MKLKNALVGTVLLTLCSNSVVGARSKQDPESTVNTRAAQGEKARHAPPTFHWSDWSEDDAKQWLIKCVAWLDKSATLLELVDAGTLRFGGEIPIGGIEGARKLNQQEIDSIKDIKLTASVLIERAPLSFMMINDVMNEMETLRAYIYDLALYSLRTDTSLDMSQEVRRALLKQNVEANALRMSIKPHIKAAFTWYWNNFGDPR